MKSIIKTRAISVAAALVLGVSGVGIAAAQAEAAGTGTVTSTEARKLLKEIATQKCLTLNEAKKIVHGQGQFDDRSYVWYGQRGSRVETVRIYNPAYGPVTKCIKDVSVQRKETSGPGGYGKGTGKVGTVTKAESRKMAKELFNQGCLAWGESRKIAHGRGVVEDTTIAWRGAKGSNIKWLVMELGDRDLCLREITIVRK